jgi:hypothetical protein
MIHTNPNIESNVKSTTQVEWLEKRQSVVESNIVIPFIKAVEGKLEENLVHERFRQVRVKCPSIEIAEALAKHYLDWQTGVVNENDGITFYIDEPLKETRSLEGDYGQNQSS